MIRFLWSHRSPRNDKGVMVPSSLPALHKGARSVHSTITLRAEPLEGEDKLSPYINAPVLPENYPILSKNRPILGDNWPILPNNWPIISKNRSIFQNNWPIISKNRPILSLIHPKKPALLPNHTHAY